MKRDREMGVRKEGNEIVRWIVENLCVCCVCVCPSSEMDVVDMVTHEEPLLSATDP